MLRERGFTVAEDIANEFVPLLRDQENTLPEVGTVLSRLGEVDTWKTKPIEIEVHSSGKESIKRSCVELIKEHRGVRVFMSPLDGRVLKAAATREKEALIRKEDHAWSIVQEVFTFSEMPRLANIVVPDTLSSPLLSLDMPYYGVPLKYWPELTGIPIPPAELDEFKAKMIKLAYEHGLVQRDLNSGNVLVRLNNSVPQLVPIDWEYSHNIMTKPKSEREAEADFVENITRRTLAPHYPK